MNGVRGRVRKVLGGVQEEMKGEERLSSRRVECWKWWRVLKRMTQRLRGLRGKGKQMKEGNNGAPVAMYGRQGRGD